jgi:hypothetical protein
VQKTLPNPRYNFSKRRCVRTYDATTTTITRTTTQQQ